MKSIISKFNETVSKVINSAIVLTTYGWIPTRSVVVSLTKSQKKFSGYLYQVVTKLALGIGVRNFEHYEQLVSAKNYIAQEFETLGYVVSFQSYSVGEQIFSNVIASKRPTFGSNPLIIGAHYDSCYNPGADDNASAVAGMLGLAKLLSEDKVAEQIVFVAFVNEEPPFFRTAGMGSRVFAKSLKDEDLQIRGAIVLEMIGYYSNNWFSQRYPAFYGPFSPNKGNFITIAGDMHSSNLVRCFAKGFQRHSAFPLRALIAPRSLPEIGMSDNWSFGQENYSAVMVTDTAHLRNPNYHRQTDLPKTLNYLNMTSVIYGLKDTIIEILK